MELSKCNSKLYLIGLYLIIANPIFAQKSRYKWKYTTTTHRVIQFEEKARMYKDLNQIDDHYKLIDSVICQCLIASKEVIDCKISSPSEAVTVLNIIDSILVANRFAICVKVSTFYEGLTLMPKSNLSCRYDLSTTFRKASFEKHSEFYHVDCDLTCIIYLGIGEILNLPLSMVEAPDHNFIRWSFKGGSYFNWDTNEHFRFSNDRYGYLNKQEIKFCNNLQNWNWKDLEGYYSFIIGRELKRQHKYFEAKNYYQRSIELKSPNPNALFCYGYMIVFSIDNSSLEDIRLANKMLREAVAYRPEIMEYQEALACSFALLGEFDAAIEVGDYANLDPLLIKEFTAHKSGINIYRSKHNVFD